jgi:replicative DNA helicase
MKPLPKIEQALIFIMLHEPDAAREIVPQLSEYHFNDELALKCFKIIKSIQSDNKQPTLVTLGSYALSTKAIEPRDLANVSGWGNDLSYTEPVNQYIAILKDEHIKRSITTILTEETLGINNNKGGVNTAVEIVKRLNSLIEDGSPIDNIITTIQLADEERQAYYRRAAMYQNGQTSGLSTGITSVNRFTGGFHPELIILAGRPSMGKTALALYHACNFNEPGIYFNLEMNNSQLCQRLILQHSKEQVNAARLRDGNLNQPELHTFEQSIGQIEKLPILIYDKPRCGVHEAIRIMRREARKGRCKWAIIDYLQLMTIEGFKGGNREMEVAEISRTLKAAQKELNIPIIALAQLSRQVEQRSDKRPILSDLRESGSIEQDADTVIFIYRPKYYGIDEVDGEQTDKHVFYLFEKHRQGATGEVRFQHNNTITAFSDLGGNIGSSFLPMPETEKVISAIAPNDEFDKEPF